jgi:hypothetical protein
MAMKIKIETIYENVTPEWLDWYIENLKNKVPVPIEKLKEGVHLSFSTKDSTSDVIAVTSYELLKGEE